MWGSIFSKKQRVIIISILIGLLISLCVHTAYLHNKYPIRVDGIYFDVGRGHELDEYSTSDVWELFNSSHMSQNYTVAYVTDSNAWYSDCLEIIPRSEPYMRISFSEEEDTAHFRGYMEYQVFFPGLPSEYGLADEAMEREMGLILDEMGESQVIESYYSDDNDFAMIDNVIDSFLCFGIASLIIVYIFCILYDDGRILVRYFNAESIRDEDIVPLFMIPGVWVLLNLLYTNIFMMWFIPGHTVCYLGAGIFIVVPLAYLVSKSKKKLPPDQQNIS